MYPLSFGMQQGNVYENFMKKYGCKNDFGVTPAAIRYTTPVLPKGNTETNRLPATFWSQMAKYYFF